MTYNKSEIMKAAWKTFKTVQASQIKKIKPYFDSDVEVMEQVALSMKPFSHYLRESWEKAKSDARYKAHQEERRRFEAVKASELKAGDTIRIDVSRPGSAMDMKVRKIAAISEATHRSMWGIATVQAEGIRITFTDDGHSSVLKLDDYVGRLKAA